MANYIRNVGKLATDRYDFQDHIDGNPPHHKAGIITLDPAVTINSVSHTTVQGAITELAPFAVTVPDASEELKGIIQLSGDLSGTATDVKASASKLQGYDIVATAPGTSGRVLTWNGTYWGAAAVSTQIVIPAGDLAGEGSIPTNPTISSLTGSTGGLITVKGHEIYFDIGQNPIITQFTDDIGASIATTLTIKAQDANYYVGGSLCLASGSSLYRYGEDDGGSAGDILLKQGSNTKIHITCQFTEKYGFLGDTSGGGPAYVIALGKEISLTDMPEETGSGVIYIANADTNPASGSPVGGTILYSSGGTLYIKQSDGRTAPVAFTAGGDLDLTSTYTNQIVSSISGVNDNVEMKCDHIFFSDSLLSPGIGQLPRYGSGANFTISAQASYDDVGGSVIISSGSGYSKYGDVILRQANDTYINITKPTANNVVIGLGGEAHNQNMQEGTGNRVIYIPNADSIPTVSPFDGVILYSSGGKLCTKQSNGVNSTLANKLVYFDSVIEDIVGAGPPQAWFNTGTSTQWVTVTQFELNIVNQNNLFAENDVIKINFNGLLSRTATSDSTWIRLVIEYGSQFVHTDEVPGTKRKIGGVGTELFPISLFGVVPIDSTMIICNGFTIHVQLKSEAALNSVFIYDGMSMTAEVIKNT